MLPDPGNALPVATDFRSPEQGFCVESAPDSKKESPDAVDLGSCEALCRATAGCVAVSYYGDGALNGWRGKCYLSLGDCTAHASKLSLSVVSRPRIASASSDRAASAPFS